MKIDKNEFNKRVKQLFKCLESCNICPRKCGVNRLKGEKGFCKLGMLPVVSSYHPHFAEESVLVGINGSGTIFFTSCNMSCVYCQNYDVSQLNISRLRKGSENHEISYEELAEIMLALKRIGCHNINLVTPTPQVPQIAKALLIAFEKCPDIINIPIVYNTNAYDSVETLKLLDGIIDIYMPDAKYADEDMAVKYSAAPGYPEIMKAALKEMHRQVGDLVIGKEGIARKGLLVRHLVLPNNIAGTEKVMRFIASEISPNTFVNIMEQYRPCYKAYTQPYKYPEISRRITDKEYAGAIKAAKKAGLIRIYRE